MATATGFINPLTGFQSVVEAPWVRQQRMDQEKQIALATLANALEQAKIRGKSESDRTAAYKEVSLEQARRQTEDRIATLANALEQAKISGKSESDRTAAYKEVGLEQARLQNEDRKSRETAAKRDERRKRALQSEARRMASKLQADVDAATEKFAAEQVDPWYGPPRPAHSKENVADFRADYAKKLAKANRAILNRMPDVKVNEDDGTFEFTGDNDLADMWDAEVAKEQGALPQKPGMNPGENPGNNPSPGAGANAGGGTPQFGITGPIGDPNTKYYMIGDSGEVIYIPRSAYFKGIGKPDPRNAPDASGGRRPSGLGSFEADMGDVESPAPAANPSPSPGVGPAATGGAPQDFWSAVVGAVRGMVSDLQNEPTAEELDRVRAAIATPAGRAAIESGFSQLSNRDQERLRKALSRVISPNVGPGVASPGATVQKDLPAVLSGMGQARQGMGSGMPSGGASPGVIAPVLQALPGGYVVAPVVGALREMYSKFRNDPTPEEIARVRELVATPEGRAQLEAGFGALSPRDQDRLKKAVSMSGVK